MIITRCFWERAFTPTPLPFPKNEKLILTVIDEKQMWKNYKKKITSHNSAYEVQKPSPLDDDWSLGFFTQIFAPLRFAKTSHMRKRCTKYLSAL